MNRKLTVLWLLLLVVGAGVASADLKVIKKSHTDAFDVMGQAQPEKNVETLTWIGEGRLRADTETVSFIVRVDLERMYLVNHADQTFSEIELPVDLNKLLPPEMAQMMSAMTFEVAVEPREETRTIGDWDCRGYDVEMTSSAMTMRSRMWVTTDVDADPENLGAMTEQIVRLQPGMAKVAAKMREIPGVRVLQEGVMTILGSEVGYGERIVSIESMDPPEGTYEPPAEYDAADLDLLGFMRLSR